MFSHEHELDGMSHLSLSVLDHISFERGALRWMLPCLAAGCSTLLALLRGMGGVQLMKTLGQAVIAWQFGALLAITSLH